MTKADVGAGGFEVRLLGTFRVRVGGKTITKLGSRAGNVLVTYLALHRGQMVDRASLADSLWPESTHKAAMDNLRHCLVDARHALRDEANRLQSPSPMSLSVDLAGAYVDVLEFERLVSSDCFDSLIDGIRAYGGKLFKDCPGDWAELERERLHGLYSKGVERLAAHVEMTRQPAAALEVLTEAFAVDQLNEPVARALMTANAAAGDDSAAIQTYSKLRIRLRSAFDSAPEPQTAALYKQIRLAMRGEESVREGARGAGSNSQKRPGFLPQPLTRLIGRDEAVLDVLAALDSSRVVTLTGMGGIGKTQLALAAAHEARQEYPEGAWFVDLSAIRLSSVRHTTEISGEILAALGENISGDADSTLYSTLAGRRALLVLDNCEHLSPGCSRVVSRLLEQCRDVRILATSRRSLRVMGENAYRVHPLILPRANAAAAAEGSAVPPSAAALKALTNCSAVALFAERAAEARRLFALTAENAPAIIGICRRLDGIPLAIELAAPWVRSLSVEQIRTRLEKHFDLLKGREPSSFPADRHRTLSTAIDWSYSLLSEAERRAWRYVSLFADGFSLEAAEAVSGSAPEDSRVLDLITSLIDASVLIYTEQRGEAWYRLPETLRQYGIDHDDWTEAERLTIGRRFVKYCAALGEEAAPHLLGADQAVWLNRLDMERANLRAAFDLAETSECGGEGLKLAAAVWRYYYVRGYYREGYSILERMILAAGDNPAELLSSAHTAAGNLAFHSGRLQDAKFHHEAALALYAEAGDKTGRARSLGNLALISNAEGDFARARELLEESRELFIEIGDNRNLSAVLGNLAITAVHEGDFTNAYRFHHDSITLFRESGDMQRVGMALANLAGLYIAQGELEPVLPLLVEALEISRTQGSAPILGHCLIIALPLAIEREQHDVAAVVIGANRALRAAFYLPLPGDAVAEQAGLAAKVQEALEPETYNDLVEKGEAMGHEEVAEWLVDRLLGF